MSEPYFNADFVPVAVTPEDHDRLQEAAASRSDLAFIFAVETHVMEENLVVDNRVTPVGWALSARLAVRFPHGFEAAWTVTTTAPHNGYTREIAKEQWNRIFMETLADGVANDLLHQLMEDDDDTDE